MPKFKPMKKGMHRMPGTGHMMSDAEMKEMSPLQKKAGSKKKARR